MHDAESGIRQRQAAEQAPQSHIASCIPIRTIMVRSAQRAGNIGDGHVAVIRGFIHRLPDFVDVETRAHAEAQLAHLGATYSEGPA